MAMRSKAESWMVNLDQEARLLLIPSNDSTLELPQAHKSVNRKKPNKSELKQNRKSRSQKGFVIVNGDSYKVNIGENGNLPIYPIIAKKMIEQLDICLDKWKRVFAIRLDFHQKHYRGDNKLMSRFICNFRKRMLKEYGNNEFGYQWARELETTKAQHYHMVLFLDGDRFKSDWNIRKLARDVWEKICDGNTLPYWDTRKGKSTHDIRASDEVAKADAVYHFSYLAKVRGKSYRDEKSKDYSSSQFTKKVRIPE